MAQEDRGPGGSQWFASAPPAPSQRSRLVTSGGPASATVPPVPDPPVPRSRHSRSTAGDHAASLLIINNTSETLQSLWLDYQGKRISYAQIAPLTSYVQPTFLTHPWIIANLQGTCYRFVVMNAPNKR